MRRFEKEYVRTNSTRHMSKLLEAIDNYEESLDSLEDEDELYDEQIEKLAVYQTAVKEYVALSDESGLAKVQTSAVEVERALKQLYVPNARVQLLLLRLTEKIILLLVLKSTVMLLWIQLKPFRILLRTLMQLLNISKPLTTILLPTERHFLP